MDYFEFIEKVELLERPIDRQYQKKRKSESSSSPPPLSHTHPTFYLRNLYPTSLSLSRSLSLFVSVMRFDADCDAFFGHDFCRTLV